MPLLPRRLILLTLVVFFFLVTVYWMQVGLVADIEAPGIPDAKKDPILPAKAGDAGTKEAVKEDEKEKGKEKEDTRTPCDILVESQASKIPTTLTEYQHYVGLEEIPPSEIEAGARIIPASLLLSIPTPGSPPSIPNPLDKEPPEVRLAIENSLIIHQSWKAPATFSTPTTTSPYSVTLSYPFDHIWHSPLHWRRWHKGWVWVLWGDEDNEKLVRDRYPYLLSTYLAFKHDISRADFVRNLYLHAFGGVYSDLDVLALSSISDHLAPFNQSLAYVQSRLSSGSQKQAGDGIKIPEGLGLNAPPPGKEPPSPPSHNAPLDTPDSKTPSASQALTAAPERPPIAYVASMNNAGELGIPNAWMASSKAGHPFWLQVAQRSVDAMKKPDVDQNGVEGLTGPQPLYLGTHEWLNKWEERMMKGLYGEVINVPSPRIFPYSWAEDEKWKHCICSPKFNTFDPNRCVSMYKDNWSVSFWGSSWFNSTPGHDHSWSPIPRRSVPLYETDREVT